MNAFKQHLGETLRLYGRNRLALFYSMLFPIIFLVAFSVLYKDRAPLRAHMGELLTVAILGGACFGLPTTLVSERERGVWRRFRLSPVPTRTLVGGTLTARYVTLLAAGLIQIGLAVGVAALIVSMRPGETWTWARLLPIPQHPLDLFVAFSFVSFAFLGLGLVIAMLADNVPSVQALGQCIFLPMLIIGGVAVRLDSLPEWAQHVSAFFPGRYAVAVLQACYTGDGLRGGGFNLAALFLIGASGCVAGMRMFRWDAHERFVQRGGKGWLALALAAWVLVGIVAEFRGGVLLASTGLVPSSVPATAAPSSLPRLPGPKLFEDEPAAPKAP